MSIYDNCTGITIKNNSKNGEMTLYYFIINGEGIISLSENELFVKQLLENQDTNFLPEDVKQQMLKDFCIISSNKIYSDDEHYPNLKNKVYLELFPEVEDEENNSSFKIFAYIEDNITQLYDYLKTFCTHKLLEDTEEKDIVLEQEKTQTPVQNMLKSINPKSIRDVKYMEELLTKLEGKFVNQNDWDKECIKIVNPTSNNEMYEESWIKLENGSDYSGQVKNGMPHGFGKEFRKDGLIYTGYFFQGKWHGIGNITTINLDNYQGEFIDGCICGI